MLVPDDPNGEALLLSVPEDAVFTGSLPSGELGDVGAVRLGLLLVPKVCNARSHDTPRRAFCSVISIVSPFIYQEDSLVTTKSYVSLSIKNRSLPLNPSCS